MFKIGQLNCTLKLLISFPWLKREWLAQVCPLKMSTLQTSKVWLNDSHNLLSLNTLKKGTLVTFLIRVIFFRCFLAMCKDTLQAEHIWFKSIKQIFSSSLTKKRARMEGLASIMSIMLPVPQNYQNGLCWPGKVRSGRKWSSSTALCNRCSSCWVAIFYLILQVSFFFIILYLSTVVFFLFSPWKTNDLWSNTSISLTLPFLPCTMLLYELSP